MSDSTLKPSPPDYIDIVFDDGPGPESGRFVEVEGPLGKSMKVGNWVKRPDGYWVLRLTYADMIEAFYTVLKDHQRTDA